jgi:hypothetical protein
LPRDKFEAYFKNKSELQKLKSLISKGKLREAFTTIQGKIIEIADDMHLEYDFVIRRILRRYIRQARNRLHI